MSYVTRTPFTEVAERFNWKEDTHDLVEIMRSFKEDDKAFGRWLKRKAQDSAFIHYAVLYHGTSSFHNIVDEGIKRTCKKSKKSIQSATGFVYLSLYQDSAFNFGDIAYPYADVSVYAVRVPIRHLLCDKDQLRNKRVWSSGDNDLQSLKDTLANSFMYGNGARVKRDVLPYEIREIHRMSRSEVLAA